MTSLRTARHAIPVWRYKRKHPWQAAALEQPTKGRVIRLPPSEEFDR